MEPNLSQTIQTIEDSFGRFLGVHRTQLVSLVFKMQPTEMRIGGVVDLAVQEDNTGPTISADVLAKNPRPDKTLVTNSEAFVSMQMVPTKTLE